MLDKLFTIIIQILFITIFLVVGITKSDRLRHFIDIPIPRNATSVLRYSAFCAKHYPPILDYIKDHYQNKTLILKQQDQLSKFLRECQKRNVKIIIDPHYNFSYSPYFLEKLYEFRMMHFRSYANIMVFFLADETLLDINDTFIIIRVSKAYYVIPESVFNLLK